MTRHPLSFHSSLTTNPLFWCIIISQYTGSDQLESIIRTSYSISLFMSNKILFSLRKMMGKRIFNSCKLQMCPMQAEIQRGKHFFHSLEDETLLGMQQLTHRGRKTTNAGKELKLQAAGIEVETIHKISIGARLELCPWLWSDRNGDSQRKHWLFPELISGEELLVSRLKHLLSLLCILQLPPPCLCSKIEKGNIIA